MVPFDDPVDNPIDRLRRRIEVIGEQTKQDNATSATKEREIVGKKEEKHEIKGIQKMHTWDGFGLVRTRYHGEALFTKRQDNKTQD